MKAWAHHPQDVSVHFISGIWHPAYNGCELDCVSYWIPMPGVVYVFVGFVRRLIKCKLPLRTRLAANLCETYVPFRIPMREILKMKDVEVFFNIAIFHEKSLVFLNRYWKQPNLLAQSSFISEYYPIFIDNYQNLL